MYANDFPEPVPGVSKYEAPVRAARTASAWCGYKVIGPVPGPGERGPSRSSAGGSGGRNGDGSPMAMTWTVPTTRSARRIRRAGYYPAVAEAGEPVGTSLGPAAERLDVTGGSRWTGAS